MKKNTMRQLVWLLLGSTAATGALAQSSIKVSGLLDIGVYRDTNKTWQMSSIQRSNIQFSGEEKLGNELTATFYLSHRFNPDDGTQESPTKPFWHDRSTVGFKGAWGSIDFGRRLDALYNNDWAFDPWFYFDRVASPAWDLWHYNYPSDPRGNSGTPDYGRLNNGIFYDSPVLSGFSLHVSGSPETTAADTKKPLTTTVKYKQSGFSGMLSRGRNSAGNTDTFLGLKAALSSFELMGAYDVSEAGPSTAKALTVGGTYSFAQWVFKAGWGQVDVDHVKAEKVLGLGSIYSLSKRTSVYADWARKSFPARTSTTYGVGLAHSF